jgi:hypothetical protein
MLELFEQQNPEVLLRKRRIDQRHGHALEREVPVGEPGILPLVRHREHAHRVQMPPGHVADLAPARGRRMLRIVAVQPLVDVEQIYLLRPQHAGKRLPLNQALVRLARGDESNRKTRRLLSAEGDNLVDVIERRGGANR